jgi:probable HAF family extracellular repeat protein
MGVLSVVAVLTSAALATGSANSDRPSYVMRDLGTFGGTASLAQGINDRGQIVAMRGVGATQAAQTGSARSLVWENGRVRWLGTLAGGATVASSINGRGQVAGISVVRGVPHLFLWRDGAMRDLGAAGGDVDGIVYHAVALNDRGEVASTRISEGGAPRAVLWRNGTLRNLGLPAAFTASHAYGINERSQVVGLGVLPGDRPGHALLWQKGTLRDLASNTNGVQLIWAFAINDRGMVAAAGAHVTGTKLNERTIRAYRWQDGRITNLGTLPGFSTSTPTAINDKGQIVGFAIAANGRRRAVLWESGRIVELPGNTGGNTFAQAINDQGQIVGAAVIDGSPHAVVWTRRG